MSKIILLFAFAIIFKIQFIEAKPVEANLDPNSEIESEISQSDIPINHNEYRPLAEVSTLRIQPYRYPSGIIHYELDPTFTTAERAVITASMAEFQNLSCVRFKERTNQVEFVTIEKGAVGTGCGGTGFNGKFLVWLGPGCIHSGPIGHELMHALGFGHEHDRIDRDKHIKILWENVLPQYQNGNAFGQRGYEATYGLPYDYQSITHYYPTAFSANKKNTLQPIPNPLTLFGQYRHLTANDGKKINVLYKGICN